MERVIYMDENEMNENMGGWNSIQGHDHEHPDMLGMMMCLAKDAYTELLKEKMKKKIDASHGKKMDEMAAVIAEGMGIKIMMMMEAKKGKMEMMEKIGKIFMEK